MTNNNNETTMPYTIFLHDENGESRCEIEGETLAEVLHEFDNLDGSDYADHGCQWLGSDYVVFPNDAEYTLENARKMTQTA